MKQEAQGNTTWSVTQKAGCQAPNRWIDYAVEDVLWIIQGDRPPRVNNQMGQSLNRKADYRMGWEGYTMGLVDRLATYVMALGQLRTVQQQGRSG